MSKDPTTKSLQKDTKLTFADKSKVKAYCYLELADYQEAVKVARLAVKKSDNNASAEVLLALSLRGIGKYHEALIHAEKAHELEPNNEEYKFAYGLCLWYSQNGEDALKIMKESIDALPERFDMRLDYAGFLLQQQRFDEALQQAQIAIEKAPRNTKALTIRKCAKDHSWCKLVNRLVTSPPMPLPENDYKTYITIGKEHLDGSSFELAMNKCSRALDLDPDNNKAKSIYATAHYLKDHDMADMCHACSLNMKKLNYRLVFIGLPAIVTIYCASYQFSNNNIKSAFIIGGAMGIYTICYLILQIIGSMNCSAKRFDNIVRSENLTPQGRIQFTTTVRNELDEIIENSVLVEDYDNLTKIAQQIERNGHRLRALSTTYASLAFLSMFCLLCAIIINSNMEHLGHSILPTIQTIAGLSAIVFSALAFYQRNVSSVVMERALEQRIENIAEVENHK